uniref:ENT domain-containing protein n=1 Tax=Ditylenchus dipsaci TaxID=166011 RepID=A0A915D8B9_9BILA
MDSIFEKHETHLPNIDPEDLTKKRAFEFVVCALRAQGPLSQYKEIILDHLKSLFFISDEDFFLRLRLSANDPVLTKISQELNPSYDNSSEWLAASYSLASLELPKILQLNTSTNKTATKCAQRMVDQMDSFNSLLVNEKEAFEQLMQVHRHVYVPEKLRRLLHDSEKDVHGRVDVAREKKGPPSTSNTKIPGVVRHVGRPQGGNRDREPATANTTTAQPDFQEVNGAAQLKQAVPAKEPPKIQNEFSIHYTGGANVVVIDPEDQSSDWKEAKVRKRKSKQDDMTCVCARVLPFIFECPPGQIKPPRGNPDKRTTKRSVHGFSTISSSTDGLLHGGGGYMHHHHNSHHHSTGLGVNMANSYISKPRIASTVQQHIHAPANNSNQEPLCLLVPAAAKRARAASMGEKDKTHIRPSLLQHSTTPDNNYTSTSYYSTTNLTKSNGSIPSTASVLKPIRISANTTTTSHIPNTIQDHQPKQSMPTPAPVANSLYHGAQQLASSLLCQEQLPSCLPAPSQPEASGLDVLASVSLLDAISTNPSTSSGTASVSPAWSSHLNTMPSTSETIQMTSTSRAPSTVCNIPTRRMLTMDNQVNETAHNFLTKHALENGEIDEATTLGSILADPALRNKLFMSAAAGSSKSGNSSGLKTTRQPSDQYMRLGKEMGQSPSTSTAEKAD